MQLCRWVSAVSLILLSKLKLENCARSIEMDNVKDKQWDNKPGLWPIRKGTARNKMASSASICPLLRAQSSRGTIKERAGSDFVWSSRCAQLKRNHRVEIGQFGPYDLCQLEISWLSSSEISFTNILIMNNDDRPLKCFFWSCGSKEAQMYW